MINIICLLTGHMRPPLTWGWWISVGSHQNKYWGTTHCQWCRKFVSFDLTEEQHSKIRQAMR